MPKLSITQLVARIEKRLLDLENGVAFEVRDINSLLNEQQRAQLKEAWRDQQLLRKLHKPPKTELVKNQIGWKTIREVRTAIYKKALDEARASTLPSLTVELEKKEIRKAKVFLDAFSNAHDQGKNALSAGNIAVSRAGFGKHTAKPSRSEQMRIMEDKLRGKDKFD